MIPFVFTSLEQRLMNKLDTRKILSCNNAFSTRFCLRENLKKNKKLISTV
jgi:hypothetical protein